MKEFIDYDDLFNYLDDQVNNSLEELSKIFKKTLYDFVKEKFYDTYEPRLYKRTWEVLKSITISSKYRDEKGYAVDVFFDTSKIHPRESNFILPSGMDRYHHHMNQNKEAINDIIVTILNNGYYFGKNNRLKRQGGKFLQAMNKWSMNKNNWINELILILKGKGLDVIIS